MQPLHYKTKSITPKEVTRNWWVIDATNQTTGRLATKVATYLRGKHKPSFTPHIACGDNVIIVNAAKVHFTGKKMQEKRYISHTGYPGGQKEASPSQWMVKDGRRVLEHAIRGMLPKNRLGRALFSKQLYVYAGPDHPHGEQAAKSLH